MTNKANIKDAVYVIDTKNFRNRHVWQGIRPSYDYFGDGEGPESAVSREYLLLNSDREGEVCLRRDCSAFEGGVLTFETYLDVQSGNGLYLAFGSRTDAFLTLIVREEVIWIENTGAEASNGGKGKVADFPYGKHYLKLYMDMVAEKVQVLLDRTLCGTFDFSAPVFPCNCMRIGYGEHDKGSAEIYFAALYVNYLVNDTCLNRYTGPLSEEYRVIVTGDAQVSSACYYGGREYYEQEYTYITRNVKGAVSVIERDFGRADGIVVLEMMYLMEQAEGGLRIALCDGSETAVSVYDAGEALCSGSGGAVLRQHHKNVWQTLRIYADTKQQTAEIWLNGKRTGSICFETVAEAVDGLRITYKAQEDSALMFSHIKVWVVPEEPIDYVPVPVIPEKKGDYVVGMNICSLWRGDNHADGWDCITAYPEAEPVLGYYDEGLPELADWEIKYQVEHGIDYGLYCWYSTEKQHPIRKTNDSHALVEGYFYAKYANMQKFALLWEAANCEHPTCLEDFKNVLVPYWLDYFFSDPRYMSVDNRAVMGCYGGYRASKDLGGKDKLREGLEYLREEVKKLGYKDMIIMGSSTDPQFLKEVGIDAHVAYHWEHKSYMLEENISRNKALIEQSLVHTVPTVSVGYSDAPWNGVRMPNLSCEDMFKALTHCREEFLPGFEQNTWKAKMLHLSNWNEYGEGTYIMPAGLNGFGYLDAVREALCVDVPHEDVIPTEAQKARIGYLYPAGRTRLQRTSYDERPLPAEERIVAKYTFTSTEDLADWELRSVANPEIRDGKLCGASAAPYPELLLKNPRFDACQVAYAKIIFAIKGSGPAFFEATNKPDGTGYTKSWRTDWQIWGPSEKMKEYTIQLDNQPGWTEPLHLGFVPVSNGTFEIESITFYAALPHITMYGKNGRQLFFGDYLREEYGEVWVPLDPADGARSYVPHTSFNKHDGCVEADATNGVMGAIGWKFEWFRKEGRLEMWKGSDRVTLRVGGAYAVKNGKSCMLKRPVYLKDGIPVIALSDMEPLFGVAWQREGNKIWLK